MKTLVLAFQFLVSAAVVVGTAIMTATAFAKAAHPSVGFVTALMPLTAIGLTVISFRELAAHLRRR